MNKKSIEREGYITMSNENTATKAPAKQDKRYNYTGTVSNVVVRKDKNDAEWVSFDLARATGKPVKCVAFTAKAAQFLAQFAEGATAKVYGFYQKRSYKAQDGAERTAQNFNLLWSGEPRTRTEGEAEAVQGEAALA